jgi:hypothetical protein
MNSPQMNANERNGFGRNGLTLRRVRLSAPMPDIDQGVIRCGKPHPTHLFIQTKNQLPFLFAFISIHLRTNKERLG